MYVPFGIVIMILRLSLLLVFMMVLCVTPLSYRKSLFYNLIAPLCFGIFIHSSGRKKGEKPNIVVCNHISNFDPLIVQAYFRNSRLVAAHDYASTWEYLRERGLWGVYDEWPAAIYTRYGGTREQKLEVRDAIFDEIKDNDRPLVIFPEGCVTSMRAVLQYQRYIFSLQKDITPIAMTAYMPFGISHYRLGKGPDYHLLLYSFCPFTSFHLHFLENTVIDEETEDPTSFSARVQNQTAAHIHLPSCSHLTLKDKDKLLVECGFSEFSAYPHSKWSKSQFARDKQSMLEKGGIKMDKKGKVSYYHDASIWEFIR
jgi:1-acyl-sn-glycerol-3-phosphate acyltransferase